MLYTLIKYTMQTNVTYQEPEPRGVRPEPLRRRGLQPGTAGARLLAPGAMANSNGMIS